MLSPSEEVVRAGRLPHNAPITVQLAHPSARQISQQIDSFINWFTKRCVPTRLPLIARRPHSWEGNSLADWRGAMQKSKE
jgi:hypothetical protein